MARKAQPEHRRDRMVDVRVSRAEEALLRRGARGAALPLTTFVRAAAVRAARELEEQPAAPLPLGEAEEVRHG